MLHTKLFLLITFLAFMLQGAQAQSDPWVGTWTSKAYEATYPGYNGLSKYKRVIRITKDADGYLVRGKIINVYNPNHVIYCPDYKVTSVNDNTMNLISTENKSPSYSDTGRIEEYCDLIWYFELTRIRGAIHYSFYKIRCDHYSPNMVFKKTTEDPSVKYYSDSQIDLYPDDW